MKEKVADISMYFKGRHLGIAKGLKCPGSYHPLQSPVFSTFRKYIEYI